MQRLAGRDEGGNAGSKQLTDGLGDSLSFFSGASDLTLGDTDAILSFASVLHQTPGYFAQTGAVRCRGKAGDADAHTDFKRLAERYSWMERFRFCCWTKLGRREDSYACSPGQFD